MEQKPGWGQSHPQPPRSCRALCSQPSMEGVIRRRVLLPSPAKSTQLSSVLRCLRAGHWEKIRVSAEGRRSRWFSVRTHPNPPHFWGVSTSSLKMHPPGTSSLLIGHGPCDPAHVPARGEVTCSSCCVLLAQEGTTVTHIRQSRASTKG